MNEPRRAEVTERARHENEPRQAEMIEPVSAGEQRHAVVTEPASSEEEAKHKEVIEPERPEAGSSTSSETANIADNERAAKTTKQD